jgi:hypothetical protein
MTLFLVVWLRKYDQNQDFDADDENMFKKSDKVITLFHKGSLVRLQILYYF